MDKDQSYINNKLANLKKSAFTKSSPNKEEQKQSRSFNLANNQPEIKRNVNPDFVADRM